MWTNNFINWTKVIFGEGAQNFVCIDGTTSPLVQPYLMDMSFTLANFMKTAKCGTINTTITNSYSDSGVYFGTGSTPATKNDYKLESMVTSGLSITNPDNITMSVDSDGRYIASATYLLTNTSGAAINIYEVGLFGRVVGKFSTSSGSVYYRPCLLERQVLSAPITIPAGGMKMVTYKITFNQTLNVEA